MLLLESILDAIFQLFNDTSEGIFISKARATKYQSGIQRRSPKYIGNFVRLSDQDMNST